MTIQSSPDKAAIPFISIVIASLNRHDELTKCLASIDNALQKKRQTCEVIIVDQSPKRYVASTSYSYPVTIIASAPGASHARNIGLQHCTGDYIWFLDDDAQVVHFLPFSQSQLDGQPILFAQWKERPCPARRNLYGGFLSRLWLIRISGTPFYLLPRHLALKSGGFDERIGPGREIAAGEDLDLLIRTSTLSRMKQPVIFIAELSHPNNRPPVAKRMLYARARGYVLARSQWQLAMAVEIIYSLMAGLRGDRHRICSVLTGYAEGLRMPRDT